MENTIVESEDDLFLIEMNNLKKNFIKEDYWKKNFKYLIKEDKHFKNEITKISKRLYNHKAHSSINFYHLKYFELFNQLLEKNESLLSSKIWVKENFDILFDEIEREIIIENETQFEKLSLILEISNILLNESIEENNEEIFLESFFQLKSRIKKYFKYEKTVYDYGNFEVHVKGDISFKNNGKRIVEEIVMNYR